MTPVFMPKRCWCTDNAIYILAPVTFSTTNAIQGFEPNEQKLGVCVSNVMNRVFDAIEKVMQGIGVRFGHGMLPRSGPRPLLVGLLHTRVLKLRTAFNTVQNVGFCLFTSCVYLLREPSVKYIHACMVWYIFRVICVIFVSFTTICLISGRQTNP